MSFHSKFANLWNINFSIFVVGEALSSLGDMFSVVALPLVVLMLNNNAMILSFVLAFLGIPRLLVMLFGGGNIGDYFGPRKIIIFANGVRCVITFAFVFCMFFKILNLMIICGYCIIYGMMSALFLTSSSSMTPFLSIPENYSSANTISNMLLGLTVMLGPLLGALIIGQDDRSNNVDFGVLIWCFLIDAITFSFSVVSCFIIDVLTKEQIEELKVLFDGKDKEVEIPIDEDIGVSGMESVNEDVDVDLCVSSDKENTDKEISHDDVDIKIFEDQNKTSEIVNDQNSTSDITEDHNKIFNQFLLLKSNSALSFIILTELIYNLCFMGVIYVALPYYSENIWRSSSSYPYIMAVFGGFSMVGSFLASVLPLLNQFWLGKIVILFCSISAILIIVFSFVLEKWWVVMILYGICACIYGVEHINVLVWIQFITPPSQLAITMNLFYLVSTGIIPISDLLVGLLLKVNHGIAFAGTLLFFPFILCFFHKGFKEIGLSNEQIERLKEQKKKKDEKAVEENN
eukprot:TRINITY_DN420_c0_g1_i1.p1 TRINITY_DN420_c0_g1~~TRINITY_DN420_c0_g1_i1.p1  ORF type:complete len:516 (+),score=105.23 TRINITY_DN420_c0_g1_i1:75-1622(+)